MENSPSTPPSRETDSVLRATRWNAIGKACGQGVRYLVYVALAAILGPEVMGLMAIALIVVGVLDQFKDAGMGQAIVRRKLIDQTFLDSVFCLNLVTGVVLCLCLTTIPPFIAPADGGEELVGILQVLGFSLLFTTANVVPRNLLVREMKFGRLAAIEIAQAVVYGAVSVCLALLGAGVWSLVIGILARSLSETLLTWILSSYLPKFRFSLAEIREILGFSVNILGFNLTHSILSRVDQMVIGGILGTYALGLYSMAQRLVLTPVSTITATFTGVLVPALARLQDDHPRLRREYLRACASIALLTFPIMLGILAVAGPFVTVVMDFSWQPAIPIIALLIPVGIVQALAGTTGAIYLAKGRADWMFRWALGFGAVSSLACWVASYWSVETVAWTYSIVNVVFAIPAFLIPFRLVDLHLAALARVSLPYFSYATFMFGIVMACRIGLASAGAGPLTLLVASTAIGMAVYTAFILLLRPPALADLKSIVAGC